VNVKKARYLFGWTLAVVFLLLFLFGRFSNLIVDWLWFEELTYSVVFFRILALKISLGVVAGAAVFVFLGLNLHYALRRALATDLQAEDNTIEILPDVKYRLPFPLLRWGGWLVAAFVAVLFALYFS